MDSAETNAKGYKAPPNASQIAASGYPTPLTEHDVTGHGDARFSLEPPLTVRDAARFLGVSPQTVYLWVERKRIPHLRVMGRNIRFLKSDLLPFRAAFRQEVENATTE
jgi:excisionase family DNA binding protein